MDWCERQTQHESPREPRFEPGLPRCGAAELPSVRARDASRRTGGAYRIRTPHDVLPVHRGHLCQRKHFASLSDNLPGSRDLRMRLLHRRSRRLLVDLGTELLYVPVTEERRRAAGQPPFVDVCKSQG